MQLQQAKISQLYQDTSDELRKMLVRKLGNQAEADEIAHDAYLKLCRLEIEDEIKDLRKYLFTMAVRMALNAIRHRKTESNYVGDYHLHQSGVEDINAYRIILGELKLELIKETLLDLPDKTRYVFLLHRFQNNTYNEIASKLDMTVKSVEYHMSKALGKVMQSVEKYNLTEGG